MVKAVTGQHARVVEMRREGDVFVADARGYSRLLKLVSRSSFDVVRVVAGHDVMIDARTCHLPVEEANELLAHLPPSVPGTQFFVEVAPSTVAVQRVTAIFLEGAEPLAGAASPGGRDDQAGASKELDRHLKHHREYNEAWSKAFEQGATPEEAHEAAGAAAYRSFRDGSR
jgi:hypothetical protein